MSERQVPFCLLSEAEQKKKSLSRFRNAHELLLGDDLLRDLVNDEFIISFQKAMDSEEANGISTEANGISTEAPKNNKSTPLTIRPLDPEKDCPKAIASLLAQLSSVDETLTQKQIFIERAKRILEQGAETVILCVKKDNAVIAMGTVFFEYKFTHGGSAVAHIEDVVVDRAHRGQGVGHLLVQELLRVAQTHPRCYKVSLNCNEGNVGFYEKNGLRENGEVRMVKYFS